MIWNLNNIDNKNRYKGELKREREKYKINC